MPNPNPDALATIPAVVADHFEFDGAAYESGLLRLKTTVSVPIGEAVGKDAAEVLDMVAAADDDRVFTKSEVKAILFKGALLTAKHYGLGKLLT